MPTQREHRMKYQENRMVLDTLFDCTKKEHCNWITTISFYTALHIIEYEFAKENIDCKTHSEREVKMRESDKFTNKIIGMYKQMGSNSRVADIRKQIYHPQLQIGCFYIYRVLNKNLVFQKTLINKCREKYNINNLDES